MNETKKKSLKFLINGMHKVLKIGTKIITWLIIVANILSLIMSAAFGGPTGEGPTTYVGKIFWAILVGLILLPMLYDWLRVRLINRYVEGIKNEKIDKAFVMKKVQELKQPETWKKMWVQLKSSFTLGAIKDKFEDISLAMKEQEKARTVTKETEELGSELALQMELWSEADDVKVGKTRVKDDGEIERIPGKYKAIAIDTGDSLYFSVLEGPATLTLEKLKRKARYVTEEIESEFTRTHEDGQYNTVDVTQFGLEWNLDPKKTIEFVRENPLKTGWKPNSIAEIPINMKDFTVSPVIDMENNIRELSLKNKASVLLGGISGSGKSASLNTIVLPFLEHGYADISVIDGKNDSELSKYKDIVEYISYIDEDEETEEYPFGKDNLKEILETLRRLKAECLQRKPYIKEKGYDNYWDMPFDKSLPIKMIVIDECQELFELTETDKEKDEYKREMIKIVKAMLRKYRTLGVFVILATQRPTANVVPTDIRGNVGFKIGLRTDDTTSEKVILGSTDEDITPTKIGLVNTEGMAVTVLGDKREYVRFAYIDNDLIEEQVERLIEKRRKELSEKIDFSNIESIL